jgi:hypothetical protein
LPYNSKNPGEKYKRIYAPVLESLIVVFIYYLVAKNIPIELAVCVFLLSTLVFGFICNSDLISEYIVKQLEKIHPIIIRLQNSIVAPKSPSFELENVYPWNASYRTHLISIHGISSLVEV